MSSLIFAVLVCLRMNTAVFADQSPLPSEEVQHTTRWGLEDRLAPVGRLFQFKLKGEIAGSIDKVAEIGSETLPNWLHYNAQSGLLEGVPGVSDVGKSYQIQVVTSERGNEQTEIDTFEIQVIKDLSATDADTVPSSSSSSMSADNKVPNAIRCLPGSAVTTATVILDADVGPMTGHERAALIRHLCSYLELPVDGIRLVETSGQIPNDDGSALVAGTGNVPRLDDGRPQVLAQWEVGCGNVFAAHMSILQRVETTAVDGSMAEAVGHGVVGWHVANKRPMSPTRLRRQAGRIFPTQTPAVVVTPPTRKPVPTATVKSPEPTRVSSSSAAATTSTRPPRAQKTTKTTTQPPSTTPRPTKPPKVSNRRTTASRAAASKATTTTTTVPTTTQQATTTVRPSTTPAVRLLPSVPTAPAVEIVHSPTPPLDGKIPADRDALAWTARLSSLSFHTNQVINMELPADTFSGPDIRSCEMQLLTMDRQDATIEWLRFNQTSHRFVGMPLERHVGAYKYILEATDPSGHMASGLLTLEVVSRRPAAVDSAAYEANATFRLDYHVFVANVTLRVQLLTALARAFDDVDTSNLSVLRVTHGSVVIAWTNTSSAVSGSHHCPREELTMIKSRMLNDDKTIKNSFRLAFRPHEVTGVSMTSRNKCGSDSISASLGSAPPQQVYSEAPVLTEPSTSSPGSASATKTAGALNTTVLIVVLIVVGVIILILVGIWCACRRRSSKKSESPDKKIKAGAPIILQYELDDAGSNVPPSKPLVGAGTERPPAPPNYHIATGAPANGTTPPLTDHRRPLLSDTGADQMSPLKYQPPPGSATRGASQRRPPNYTAT